MSRQNIKLTTSTKNNKIKKLEKHLKKRNGKREFCFRNDEIAKSKLELLKSL
tara:strand:- start:741 stop:896 length:156 start_codon:yes stop_codon:yes gene_type:complete